MIEKSESLSIPESMKYVEGEEQSDIKGFLGKFAKISTEDATSLREEITKMDLMKVRQIHISKIIDLLPESKEELNKIFTDASLEENEIAQILDAIKKYK